MVRVLSKLSPAERASIKTEVVLVPDTSGPLLLPASDLVYDDAPWLTSRLRQVNLRLVHPEVGDEAAKSVGVRGLREVFIDSQGGNQVMLRATRLETSSYKLGRLHSSWSIATPCVLSLYPPCTRTRGHCAGATLGGVRLLVAR